MALTDTDRRRMIMATAVTIVALPALWLANSDADSTARPIAVAGIDVGGGDAGSGDVEGGGGANDQSSVATTDTIELGAAEPVFLDGPSSREGAGQQVIAVPSRPSVDGIVATATFRSSIPGAGACIVPAVPAGSRVTVVNLDNNRSITCTSIRTSDTSNNVVLDTTAFAELADLTDAPISVEIRQ